MAMASTYTFENIEEAELALNLRAKKSLASNSKKKIIFRFLDTLIPYNPSVIRQS